MKKVAALCIIVILVAGCGPTKVTDEERQTAILKNVKTHSDSGSLIVSWDSYEGGLIAGYNIYVSISPLTEDYPGTDLPESIPPHNAAPFPGDTEPGDKREHYVADGLENGIRYYVSVRVAFPDESLSPPSEEIVAVCGPSGEIELSIRYKSGNDGYSFVQDEYVKAGDMANDIYFYSKDGVDYLASPTRLDAFLRGTNFATLPHKGEIDEVRQMVRDDESQLFGDRVVINTGDWVLMKTPESAHALLRVLGFSGEGESRKVRLFYSFSSMKNGEIFF
jgi:hypothetical protein